MLNKGIIKIFEMTDQREALPNTFTTTGNVIRLIANDVRSGKEINCGTWIEFVNFVNLGTSVIIEKIHKNDNWNPTSNKDNGLINKIIIPAILSELSTSYFLPNNLQIK